MASSPAEKPLNYNVLIKKKQDATRSLNNYMEQIKIHFDLDDRDIVQVLDTALKERRNENLLKKWWHILK